MADTTRIFVNISSAWFLASGLWGDLLLIRWEEVYTIWYQAKHDWATYKVLLEFYVIPAPLWIWTSTNTNLRSSLHSYQWYYHILLFWSQESAWLWHIFSLYLFTLIPKQMITKITFGVLCAFMPMLHQLFVSSSMKVKSNWTKSRNRWALQYINGTVLVQHISTNGSLYTIIWQWQRDLYHMVS